MLTAITRKVSSSLPNCELNFIERKPIDMERARAQHHAYESLLEKLGANVNSLPEERDLPDSMFVEDPAIVLDEVAVICTLGTETRRKEAASLAAAIEPYRKLAHVKLPGMLEGGDVLRVGKKIFVGLTQRSNAEGIRQFDGRACDRLPPPEIRRYLSWTKHAPRQPRVVSMEAIRRL